jgi:hypothetical protein
MNPDAAGAGRMLSAINLLAGIAKRLRAKRFREWLATKRQREWRPRQQI